MIHHYSTSGHADVAIGDEVFMYGRYDGDSTKPVTRFTSDGVLIVADKDLYIDKQSKYVNYIVSYSFNATPSEADNLKSNFYKDTYEWPTGEFGMKYKYFVDSEYEQYELFLGDNCSTVLIDALQATFDDKFQNLNSLTPYTLEVELDKNTSSGGYMHGGEFYETENPFLSKQVIDW